MHSWQSGGLILTVQEERKIKTPLSLVLSLVSLSLLVSPSVSSLSVSLLRERRGAMQLQDRDDKRGAS